MIDKIKQFFKKVRVEAQPELDRINAFWDEKTIFVHRRALWIGVVLG